MIFKLSDLKNIISDGEFYNFPEDWSSNGIVIWHTCAYENNMVLVREQGEKWGVLKEQLPNIIDKASAIVTTSDDKYERYNKPVIKIKDIDDTLISLAKYARNKLKGKVIAVTGSCDKTTCANIVNNIFNKFGSDTNKSANTFLGISWELTNFNSENNYWVVETSLGGRMVRSSDLLEPDYAVITNIAPVHLEEWQDVSFIARRNSEIFDSMKKGSVAILYNEMDQYEIIKQAALSKELKIITFGTKNSDAIVNCQKGNNYIEYSGEKYILNNSIVPQHIMLDMAAAIIVAKQENIDNEHICKILNEFEYPAGRGKTLRVEIMPNTFITVTDETYNANPISMRYALEAFKQKEYKSSLLILGDMAEGGKETIKHHLELEKTIREINPSRILFCGTIMKHLWEILKFDYPCAYYSNYKELNFDVLNWIKNEDGIFIKGSRSTGLSQTVELLTKKQVRPLVLSDIKISEEADDIKKEIVDLFAQYPSFKPSVFLYEYSNQFGVDINANENLPGASTINMFILNELMIQLSENKLKLTDEIKYEDKYFAKGSGILKQCKAGDSYTIDYLAKIMITESDIIAANMLLDKIGGIKYLNLRLKQQGFTNVKIENKWPDLNGKNRTSAYELSKLIYNMDIGNHIKYNYVNLIKTYLIQPKKVNYLQKLLPKNVDVYNKTGTIDIVMGDCGIIEDKQNNCKYIASVLVSLPYLQGDKEFNSQSRKTGRELIQKISLILYNGVVKLNKKKNEQENCNACVKEGILSVELPKELEQQFKFFCKLHNISPSILCNKLIKWYLNKKNIEQLMSENDTQLVDTDSNS